MSSAPVPTQKKGPTLSKQTRITVLTLLKNFYEERIFAILANHLFDSDLDVSLAAIDASASLGNEAAVGRLYTLLEKGKPEQKLAAIRALAAINAPSSIEKLAEYFTGLPQVRKEILRAVNGISAQHPKTRELNRAALVDPAAAREYYEIVLGGLLEAGDLDLVRNHLLRAAPEVQRAVFQKVLAAGSEEIGAFLEYFRDKTGQFDPTTLGCFLCALELKVPKLPPNHVVELLSASDGRATTSFLMSLANYSGSILNPGRIFRLLLKLPYVDQDTEAHTGDFITKVVAGVRSDSPQLLNEFVFSTSANLEAVFARIKKQHISLKGIKEKEELLAVVLAKLLEQYASRQLLSDLQSHFRADSRANPVPLVARMKEAMISAPEDDLNKLEACLPLFTSPERMVRMNVAHTLGRVDLASPALMRRLNRLIRVIGILEVRTAGKKLLEVLSFAREERIGFLEESTVVTLCQLLNRAAIEQAKLVFASPARFPHSLAGYIRGARFMPARIFAAALLRLLLQPGLADRQRNLAIDSLKVMELAEIRNAPADLIRAMRLPGLDRGRLQDLGAIVARLGNPEILQHLIDLTGSGDQHLVFAGVHALHCLAGRDKSLSREALTRQLYMLLEHKQKNVQVEALLTLIALEDDYAGEILEDYRRTEDEEALVQILANLDRPIGHEMVLFLLKLLGVSNAAVHRELRQVLPDLCQGNYAEEIRSALMGTLKGQGLHIAAAPSKAAAPEAGFFRQAKLDLIFRRENTQELTVFFTDMVEFTRFSSSTSASTLFERIKTFEHFTLPTIESLHGELIKKMGDGLLAVFKHPLNAVAAALQIQAKIRQHNQSHPDIEKFNVRIGLNTGMVIRKDGDVFGDTVNVASRMQTSATPGDVLLTQVTYGQIREYVDCTHLGSMQLKGKPEPVVAYSARKLLVNVNQLLKESQDGQGPGGQAAGSRNLASLKESMFEPDFSAPAGQARAAIGELQLRNLQAMFKDFTKLAGSVSRNHHEEFLLKSYLQSKWRELFAP